MKLTSAGFAALFFLATANATPITLTFSGTASGTVNGTAFSNQAFTITFNSDTTAVCIIGTSPCPTSGDIGDYTTPNPTLNTFTIGSIVSSPAQLTGMGLSLGPAVFLNTTTHNVGIWFYNSGDWLVTADAAHYTSSFGLTHNLSLSSLTAFSDEQLAMGPDPMQSTVGPVDFTSVSNVSFSEVVAAGTPAAVPEPSTLTMLGIGAGGLFLGRIRRRSA